MANFEGTTISRPVRTKNNEEFFNVFLDLGFEESCEINGKAFVLSYGEATWSDDMFVIIDKNTNEVVGGYDANVTEMAEKVKEVTGKRFSTLKELEANYKDIPIAEYVQQSLLEDEAFVLKEVGNKKLHYNSGWAIVITKNDIKSFDLDLIINDYLRRK